MISLQDLGDSKTVWRRTDQGSRPFNGKHPTGVFLIEDDGSGKPLVQSDVGWPPYIHAIPTDGRGRFAMGRAKALERQLPRRVSKPLGIDNNPYRIDHVIPAHGEEPARVEGRIVDNCSRSSSVPQLGDTKACLPAFLEGKQELF